MIVGYQDKSGELVCGACWQKKPEAERHANAVLTDDPDEHDDNLWLVDDCDLCGKPIKYMTKRLLD